MAGLRTATKVSWIGFGVSIACLSVWFIYAQSAKWQPTVLATFDDPPAFVGYPAGLRYSLGIFYVLNLPSALAVEAMTKGAGRFFDLPSERAVIWISLQAAFCCGWWWCLNRVFGIWRSSVRRPRDRPT